MAAPRDRNQVCLIRFDSLHFPLLSQLQFFFALLGHPDVSSSEKTAHLRKQYCDAVSRSRALTVRFFFGLYTIMQISPFYKYIYYTQGCSIGRLSWHEQLLFDHFFEDRLSLEKSWRILNSLNNLIQATRAMGNLKLTETTAKQLSAILTAIAIAFRPRKTHKMTASGFKMMSQMYKAKIQETPT